MMTIQINNTTELLEFIKRDDVTTKQATEIVCEALNVVSIFEKTKPQLIEITEYFINEFYQSNSDEHPIFLEQTGAKFNIEDLYKVPECKKIIDDLEAKY